ncbi:hypothetical protein GCM10023156_52520 [Novipirellula rosea]|uniref:Uncharacterized protein n=1 Tax=Novipirellula rosea TaxID=1031540 RepID=A0ABP8NFZ3_9BACT
MNEPPGIETGRRYRDLESKQTLREQNSRDRDVVHAMHEQGIALAEKCRLRAMRDWKIASQCDAIFATCFRAIQRVIGTGDEGK